MLCVSFKPVILNEHSHTYWTIHSEMNLQITFIVTAPQHKCLGEWNSYERAPDSAKKTKQFYIWTVRIYRLTEDNVQNTHTYTPYT